VLRGVDVRAGRRLSQPGRAHRRAAHCGRQPRHRCAHGGRADLEGLGQPVLVENRPGASSLVGTQFVAKATPDGYTLLAIANTFVTVPLIVPSPGYDPLKDFSA